MFLENDYARPLFDFEKGGKPSAYMCLAYVDYKNKKLFTILERAGDHICGKITRTERGMRMHLKIVHGWEEQPCLYSKEHQRVVSPRDNLRAGKPLLNQNVSAEPESVTAKIPASQKSPEMKEGKLLKLMREEK